MVLKDKSTIILKKGDEFELSSTGKKYRVVSHEYHHTCATCVGNEVNPKSKDTTDRTMCCRLPVCCASIEFSKNRLIYREVNKDNELI